jgi:DNA-binding IclR family transcriptional regulator
MTEPGAGLKVVEKVGRLLRAIGGVGPAGLTTSAAALSTGLSRPTAHRLLLSLMDEGLVDRDPSTGRWQLGPELYLLGSAAASRYDVTAHARDALARLAEATGESAYLSALRGQQTVCLLEEEGSFPLRSHVLTIGIRFPLGVASAGLAILAHLPPAESERYIGQSDLTRAWGETHARASLARRVAATREAGYALNPGLLVPGSWGLGAAVFDPAGRPAWALSLTGVEARIRPPRQHQLGRQLLAEAHRLTQRLNKQRS